MSALSLDLLFDFLTGVTVLVALLWLGLASLTVALLVLTRTRWGQSQPLRKCVILSLLAHVLLVGYATTVQIVASAPRQPAESVVRVSIDTGPVLPQETADAAEDQQKPWESFAREAIEHPAPPEPVRAEPVEMPRPQRRPPPKPWSPEPSLDTPPPADLVQPERETLPENVPVSEPAAGKPPQPIEAPVAQRRQTPQPELPQRPALARPDYAGTASPPPIRKHDLELPSALLERPVPIPKLTDLPTSPNPQQALSDVADALPSPSQEKPAEWSDEQRPQTGAGGQVATVDRIGPTASEDVHLKPPSNAQRGGPAIDPLESRAVGPPLLPVARHGRDLPEIYKLRVAPDRSRIAARRGATAQTERCVQAALEWLAENQEPDGRWSPRAHGAGRELHVAGRDRLGAGVRADTGVTALALLAFLASGHTSEEGLYASIVDQGLGYLIRQQAADGGLGGEATTFASMYCHAMATLALSEAYGMTGQPRLREPVRRAVAYTLAAQNPSSGGWRYYRGDPGDTSQLGWQLMALKSADLAGIPLSDRSRRQMIRFLDAVSSGNHRGLASYRPSEPVTRPMTAEALACRQFLGAVPSPAAAAEAADYLLGELPGDGAKNFYYWYYGTLAVYQLQGDPWRRWNDALSQTLTRSQRKLGPAAGSWDPDSVWGGYGGRVYSTAMATLCLEVYYRYLPLYLDAASGPQPAR